MNRQRGLTLVELMVTLAVAIILIAVGMPLFTGVAANNRATTQANTFLTAFKLARSEAVKRATNVSVCAIDDPDASPPTCGGNDDWDNGLLVFTDGDTAGTIDGGDERIRAFPIATAGSVATTSQVNRPCQSSRAVSARAWARSSAAASATGCSRPERR